MVKNSTENTVVKNYKKTGIVAAVVIAVAALGIWAVSALNSDNGASVADAMTVVSEDAASGANLRIAVIRMDAIQGEAVALKDLRAQKEKYENISKELIESEFPETSFSAGLLTSLLDEPKEAQLAYELLKSLKEGK